MAMLVAGLFALCACGAVGAQGARAQTASGTIAGRVVEADTERPLAGAEVRLVGRPGSVLTDAAGHFALDTVPPGRASIEVASLGFAPAVVDTTVAAGERIWLPVSLTPRALALDRIVVTATGEQRARSVAHDVAVIDVPAVLEGAPTTTVADLLRARAPGIQVLGSSGSVASGARIRIRGASSINLANDPVVYLDGIRIDADPRSGSIDIGGQAPSRLNDLNPDEIASIEVVRGPSAATLYGTDAAHGVIRITTRRGRAGERPLRVWVETGRLDDRNEYPDNYFGRTASGAECFVFMIALGMCSQDGQLRSNPLMDPASSPLVTGSREQVGASLAGAVERLDWYLSAEWEREHGVFGLPAFDRASLRDRLGAAFDDLPPSQLRPDALRRVSLRANVGGQVFERASMRISTGYVASDLRFPQNDNNQLGVIPSGLLGWPDGSAANRYGYRFFLPSEIYAQAVSQRADRLVTSARFDAQPLAWLTARAVAGLDLVTRTDIQHVPRGRVFFGSVLPTGVRDVNTARILTSTVDVGLTARRPVGRGLEGRLTLGTQYVRSFFTRTDAHGEDLVGGSGSLGGAVVTRAAETTTESKTLGTYVEGELALADHLFVTGALRADDNSAFGADFDLILYPKIGVSWVVSEAEVLPPWESLSHLRLRAAWGQSGAQPGPTDALETYDARAVTIDGGDVLGVTFGSLGNPDLEPERSSELEVGLDAAFLGERLSFELTHYRKSTRDLIVRQAVPPSAGAGVSRLVNLGEVRNAGLEVGGKVLVLDAPALGWELTAAGSTNVNELTDLGTLPGGEPTPRIEQGLQWFVEGYPLAGYWDRPVGFADLDGDGLIHPLEVAIGDEPGYLGSSLPKREVSLGTSLTLMGGRIRLGARLDHRGGHKLRNLTEVLRCRYTVCRGYNDPTAPLHDQARALTQTILPLDQRTEALFVEDASFWKLRELGITLRAPADWAARIGAGSWTVSLTGRNLATWTAYTGLDPEVNQYGAANFLTRDLLTQPPVRTYSLRMQATF